MCRLNDWIIEFTITIKRNVSMFRSEMKITATYEHETDATNKGRQHTHSNSNAYSYIHGIECAKRKWLLCNSYQCRMNINFNASDFDWIELKISQKLNIIRWLYIDFIHDYDTLLHFCALSVCLCDHHHHQCAEMPVKQIIARSK